jgi:hypothetical protein
MVEIEWLWVDSWSQSEMHQISHFIFSSTYEGEANASQELLTNSQITQLDIDICWSLIEISPLRAQSDEMLVAHH